MADVFISFIHEEQGVASALQKLLKNHLERSSQVFLSSDDWQIYAGEIWLTRIHEELESAKVVILMLSQTSVVRPWVNFEAGAAWNKKPIIPACFCGLTKESLPKPYSSIQSLNLPQEACYLVRSVHHHLTSGQGLRSLSPFPFADEDDAYRNLRQEIEKCGGAL